MSKPRRVAIQLELEWPYKRHAALFAGTQQYACQHGWESIIDDFVADADRPFRCRLQPSQQSKRRRFSASRRTDDRQQFTISYIEIQIDNRAHVTLAGTESLRDVVKRYTSHLDSSNVLIEQ